jgi:hypothetical protein
MDSRNVTHLYIVDTILYKVFKAFISSIGSFQIALYYHIVHICYLLYRIPALKCITNVGLPYVQTTKAKIVNLGVDVPRLYTNFEAASYTTFIF